MQNSCDRKEGPKAFSNDRRNGQQVKFSFFSLNDVARLIGFKPSRILFILLATSCAIPSKLKSVAPPM